MIARVLAALREDSEALRERVVAWIDRLRDADRSVATLRQRWRTYCALVTACRNHTGELYRDPGPLPSPDERTSFTHADAIELVDDLAARGRWRDAAIVGLLADVGMTRARVLDLRAFELPALDPAAEVARALRECVRGQKPQTHVIRSRSGSPLSGRGLVEVLAGFGLTVARCRGAAPHPEPRQPLRRGLPRPNVRPCR